MSGLEFLLQKQTESHSEQVEDENETGSERRGLQVYVIAPVQPCDVRSIILWKPPSILWDHKWCPVLLVHKIHISSSFFGYFFFTSLIHDSDALFFLTILCSAECYLSRVATRIQLNNNHLCEKVYFVSL